MPARNQPRGPRHIATRHPGKIVATLAVALSVAAITAPGASAAVPGPDGGSTPCAYQTFNKSNTFNQCVQDEQVLLNDLRNAATVNHLKDGNHIVYNGDRILTTDGIYGNNTWSDVYAFNLAWSFGTTKSGTTTGSPYEPFSVLTTWYFLCHEMRAAGLSGGSTYYVRAGCQFVSDLVA